MRPALAALVVAAIVAGCGSDRLSAGELRTRAANFCSLAGQRTQQIPTPSSPAGGTAFLQRGLAALEPELERLRKLRAPTDLERLYASALDSSSRELAAMRAAIRQLRRGANPVDAVTALQQRLAPLEASQDSAWRALGIPACATR